jgi:hypothetical protein
MRKKKFQMESVKIYVLYMSNFFNSSDFRPTDLELLSPKRVVGHNRGVVNLDIVIKRSLRYIDNERKKSSKWSL